MRRQYEANQNGGVRPLASGDAARSTSGRDGRATMQRFRIAGLAMRLKRERQTNHSDAFFKTSAFLSSLIESTRPPSAEYAEMYAATVRSWLRSEWWAPQRRRLA